MFFVWTKAVTNNMLLQEEREVKEMKEKNFPQPYLITTDFYFHNYLISPQQKILALLKWSILILSNCVDMLINYGQMCWTDTNIINLQLIVFEWTGLKIPYPVMRIKFNQAFITEKIQYWQTSIPQYTFCVTLWHSKLLTSQFVKVLFFFVFLNH